MKNMYRHISFIWNNRYTLILNHFCLELLEKYLIALIFQVFLGLFECVFPHTPKSACVSEVEESASCGKEYDKKWEKQTLLVPVLSVSTLCPIRLGFVSKRRYFVDAAWRGKLSIGGEICALFVKNLL